MLERLAHTTSTELIVAFILAAVMAVVVAVIIDLLPVGDSRILAFIRLVKNKLSERSIARLQERIRELVKYRDSLRFLASSDKAHYLNALRLVIGILLCICVAGIILLAGHFASPKIVPWTTNDAETARFIDLFAILFLTIGIVVGMQGLSVASWDTHEKLETQIKKVEVEITVLELKLESDLLKRQPNR